jgi:D-beta-D-heptose 7-phosphate kinase / D-beta-D-heptose 1-phosphate adenosyltransferase
MTNKIRTIDQMEEIARHLRLYGKIIVTTNGSFDILHSAHVRLLQKMKNEGDILVVLLNSDGSIKRNKGEKRPIVPQTERANLISSLGCVDYVVIFNDDKPLQYLARIKGDIQAKGGSYDHERMGEEKAFVESWGGEYKTFELEEGFSTSEVIKTILDRYSEASHDQKYENI